MDYDYGINPAFSNDESVEYPPSLENQRRSNQYSEAGNARYYSDAEIINDLQMDEDDDENEIFEHTLSEHEYNTDAPYADEYDSAEDPYYIDTTSESQMSKSQGKMKRRQPFTRKTLLGMLALVLFVVVLALGIATASKKNNGNQQSGGATVSESNSVIVNPTSKSPTPTPPPTKSPVVAPTKDLSKHPTISAPYDHKYPTYYPPSPAPYDHKYPTHYPPSPTPYHPSSNGHYPTPDYDMHPTPDEYMHPTPTTTDHSYPYYSKEDMIMCNRDKIHVDKRCYTFGESIEITYKLCNPGEHNWLVIFHAQELATDTAACARSHSNGNCHVVGKVNRVLMSPQDHVRLP